MRLVFFDVETTGTKPETDRIVELCLMSPGGPPETFRVHPGVPIPPEATAVHGIGDADVRDAPPFAQVAPKVQTLVEGAVLVGYNSRSFDTPMLDAELRRAGQPGLRLDEVQEIDVLRVWNALEPRTLSGAVSRWLGASHKEAHRASGDVEATFAVWNAILRTRRIAPEEGIRLSRPENEVDRAGRFVRNDQGEVVLTFGKHAHKPASSIPTDYLEWMMGSDFPASTKAVVSQILAARAAPRRVEATQGLRSP